MRVNGERAAAFDLALRPGDELRVGCHRFLRVVAPDGGEGEETA